MIKKIFAVAALSCALPAFAAISEVENNGSIPTAQALGLTGAGAESILGAITTNPLDGQGDYDFFNLGRFDAGGNIKVRVVGYGGLDPAIGIYSAQRLQMVNDDEKWPELGTQSYLDYITLAEDNYFLAVFSARGTSVVKEAVSKDPFSETPGNPVTTVGAYKVDLIYDTGFVPPPPASAKPSPMAMAVPEPSGVALSAVGLLALLGMRRKRSAA